jgi:hypothetical protein
MDWVRLSVGIRIFQLDRYEGVILELLKVDDSSCEHANLDFSAG